MAPSTRTLAELLAMRGEEGARACNARGLAANASGDASTALKLFLRARELQPSQPNYALSAANMHIKCRQPAAAIALFEKLLRDPSALTPKQLEVANVKLGEARRLPTLLWAACSRDETVLAERGGEDPRDGSVLDLAKQTLAAAPTPGWEFGSGRGGLRAVKFHVHDAGGRVWAVSCVHDQGVERARAQRFVTAVVLEMQPLRSLAAWAEGGTLAAQQSFAPSMQRRLDAHRDGADSGAGAGSGEGAEQAEQAEEADGAVARDGAAARVRREADGVTALMHDNIELLLARGRDLRELQEEAAGMSRLARTFQQQATKARRFQMWQQAKFGAAVGGAITVGAVVLLAPILL